MQRRELLALSALVLVALGLRLGVALVPRCIATDGVAYLELAEQIAAGEGWHHPMFPPGYPLLVAAAHGLTGIPFERSALLVSAICGALVLLPAYAFWRRALGARAALAAAALLAVWPLSISLPGPTGLAQRVFANAGHSLRLATRIWPPVLLTLVAIGAFLGWRQRRLGDWIWLAVLAAAPILLLFVKPRFFYASSAVLLGLAGLAVAYTRGVRLWVVAALAALLLVPQALRPLHGEDRHGAWRAAGLWLAAQPGPATTVIDRKPFVAYYADRPHAWPPPRPGLAGLREQLSAHESVVLVVDNRYFARSRPDWFEALASPPPWLEELARFRGPGGHEVRLLRAHAELAGAGGPAAGVKRGSDAPG